MWHVPLLDLHGGRVMGTGQYGTWLMGHMSTRGRVMVHMGDRNRDDGHMGDKTHCHNNAYI